MKRNPEKEIIASSEISVVVQGAVNAYTPDVLAALRRIFPAAELILSCWEQCDAAGLQYDVLLKNQDPGAEMLYPEWKQLHNLNRQIVSTSHGIRAATRKYVLKTRTDILHLNANFLNYYRAFPQRAEKMRIFKERVLIEQFYIRSPAVLPYHISDWVFFGLREDLLKIWDIPLAPEPETTHWFRSRPLLPQHMNPNNPHHFFRHRFCAEQYICKSMLEKFISIKFDHMFDVSPENTENTYQLLANNFIVLDLTQYGVVFLKETPHDMNVITFWDWLDLYKIYCDPEFDIQTQQISLSRLMTKVPGKLKALLFKQPRSVRTTLKRGASRLRRIIGRTRSLMSKPLRIYMFILKAVKHRAWHFIARAINNRDVFIEYEYWLQLKERISPGYRQIVVINSNLGETIYLARHLNYLIGQGVFNGARLVTPYKKNADIIRMISGAEVDYVPSLRLGEEIKVAFRKCDYFLFNHSIKVLWGNDFWFTLWQSNPKEHFSTLFFKALKQPYHDMPALNLRFSQESREQLLAKLLGVGLKTDKFVVLFPEATSQDPTIFGPSFWKKLEKSLNNSGFDVLYNLTKADAFGKVKSCPLTFSELYMLGEMSKGIVGLRSGVLELFLGLKTPLFSLYTNVSPPTAHHHYNFKSNYSMRGYGLEEPQKLYEYSCSDYGDHDEIMQAIIKEFM